MRIAVDAMRGGLGCPFAVSACVKIVEYYPDSVFILCGDKRQLSPLLADFNKNITIKHCDAVVGDNDSPAKVLKSSTETSMHCAINCVVSDEVDAAISAGNTGAWWALAFFRIGRIEAVKKPALCSEIPSVSHRRWMLDLGANPNCKPEYLNQFAVLGHALAESMGVNVPTARLLNIGVEPDKGNTLVQASAKLLKINNNINYKGFVEPDELFTTKANLIICDGFSGNIALKASEGAARFTSQLICRHAGISQDEALSIANPQYYNGAFVLGLNKLIVKTHGNSDAVGFFSALEKTIMAIKHNTIHKICNYLN